jgi:hypothetical protein
VQASTDDDFDHILLELHTPDGTRGLYVESLSTAGGEFAEFEVVLARDTQFKITSKRVDPEGFTHIVADVLPVSQIAPSQALPPYTTVMHPADARALVESEGGVLSNQPFYHFTRPSAVPKIKSGGFRLSNGLWGRGIYATEIRVDPHVGRPESTERLDLMSRAKNPFIGTPREAELLRKAEIVRLRVAGNDAAIADFEDDRQEEYLPKLGYDAWILVRPHAGDRWLFAFNSEDVIVLDDTLPSHVAPDDVQAPPANEGG